jgi:magnesium transporter
MYNRKRRGIYNAPPFFVGIPQQPKSNAMMIYTKSAKGLTRTPFSEAVVFSADVVWLDILNLTPVEEKRVEAFLQLNIPSREEMHEIELSNRLYQENNAVYMTAALLTNVDTGTPETHSITFILKADCLITLRYSEPSSFRVFGARAEKYLPTEQSGKVLFAGLVESIIERIADILERSGKNIDAMTNKIFRQKITVQKEKVNYQEILEKIGYDGDLISKTTESLLTLHRMVGYVLQSPVAGMQGEARILLDTLARDIIALTEHASFLSNKISFLLDATLGMINIEQNNIIKMFSVAAVVFLPPTLIASVYGMNFEQMPELKWQFGYPFAVILMGLSALLPYLYAKKRKWL